MIIMIQYYNSYRISNRAAVVAEPIFYFYFLFSFCLARHFHYFRVTISRTIERFPQNRIGINVREDSVSLSRVEERHSSCSAIVFFSRDVGEVKCTCSPPRRHSCRRISGFPFVVKKREGGGDRVRARIMKLITP